jgi:hypothetical protein
MDRGHARRQHWEQYEYQLLSDELRIEQHNRHRCGQSAEDCSGGAQPQREQRRSRNFHDFDQPGMGCPDGRRAAGMNGREGSLGEYLSAPTKGAPRVRREDGADQRNPHEIAGRFARQ